MSKIPMGATVLHTAIYLAAEKFLRDNTGASEQDASAWGRRHWRFFVPMALDYLAITTALEEQAKAAPWN